MPRGVGLVYSVSVLFTVSSSRRQIRGAAGRAP